MKKKERTLTSTWLKQISSKFKRSSFKFELDTLKRFNDKTLVTMRDNNKDVVITITFDSDYNLERLFKRKRMKFV